MRSIRRLSVIIALLAAFRADASLLVDAMREGGVVVSLRRAITDGTKGDTGRLNDQAGRMSFRGWTVADSQHGWRGDGQTHDKPRGDLRIQDGVSGLRPLSGWMARPGERTFATRPGRPAAFRQPP
jgi:hypothetical protein